MTKVQSEAAHDVNKYSQAAVLNVDDGNTREGMLYLLRAVKRLLEEQAGKESSQCIKNMWEGYKLLQVGQTLMK